MDNSALNERYCPVCGLFQLRTGTKEYIEVKCRKCGTLILFQDQKINIKEFGNRGKHNRYAIGR